MLSGEESFATASVSCLLFSSTSLQNEASISSEPCCRKERGWEVFSPTFLLDLFCGWETAGSEGKGRRKLKQEISYLNILEVSQAPRPLWVEIHNDGITGWERNKNNIFMGILWGYKCYWNMRIWPQMKTTLKSHPLLHSLLELVEIS